MEKDLIWIKKHYGEKMMHLCRKYLFGVLETEGLLPKILNEHFEKNKSLAEDIILSGKEGDFRKNVCTLLPEACAHFSADGWKKACLPCSLRRSG